MGKIHWLASYPKSGNTWVRILLTNYLRDQDAPAAIDRRLEGGPVASARIWFDEWVGVEASTLDDETIECLRPEVYRRMAAEEPQPIYMKTHDAWKQTPAGDPLFPGDVTRGVVYIVRNPLDLAASLANHYAIDLERAVAQLCDARFALGRSVGELADQLRQFTGDWSGHVRSWLDRSGLPCLTVRYEDLLGDTPKVFGEVVRFLGLPWNKTNLEKAVTFSSFAELRRQESEVGFPEKPGKSTAFFRRGVAGGWRQELSPVLSKRLIAAHGETMRRFGYLDEQGEPV